MAADQDKDPGELPVDPLLGQPRMVDDRRISVAQGAVILGKKPARVHRYVALGRLPRHGPANNGRPLLLSEVEALRDKGEPIPLKDAARTLGRSLKATRELVADGHLPLVPGTKSMVYPSELAAFTAAKAQPPIRRPAGPPGYLNTKQTAERLGLTVIYVSQLAAEERLPAIFRDRQWWFDPARIEMIRRARRARRDRVVARQLRRGGGTRGSEGLGSVGRGRVTVLPLPPEPDQARHRPLVGQWPARRLADGAVHPLRAGCIRGSPARSTATCRWDRPATG
jgi:hypothetical protein